MIHIIVEKKTEKKLKKTYYEVFHVTEYEDVLGKPARIKQLAGPTTPEALTKEIANLQEQIDYRQQVLDEIADIEKRKATHTKLEDVLAKMDSLKLN